MYRSEKEMSLEFERYIKTIIGNTYYKEWKGLFGIPDYVCFSKDNGEINVISFELKLTDWKGALMQAFRYKSFSDYSYVVLPEETTSKALKHMELFIQYGIGLVSFNNASCNVRYSPSKQKPFSNNMREKVESKIRKSRKLSKGNINFFMSNGFL